MSKTKMVILGIVLSAIMLPICSYSQPDTTDYISYINKGILYEVVIYEKKNTETLVFAVRAVPLPYNKENDTFPIKYFYLLKDKETKYTFLKEVYINKVYIYLASKKEIKDYFDGVIIGVEEKDTIKEIKIIAKRELYP